MLNLSDSGHEEIVKKLIENGADVYLTTEEGWTAKDLAQENSQYNLFL